MPEADVVAADDNFGLVVGDNVRVMLSVIESIPSICVMELLDVALSLEEGAPDPLQRSVENPVSLKVRDSLSLGVVEID